MLTHIASLRRVTDEKTTRRAPSLPPAERRAAIIETTIPLFFEHGEQVTTRQIADAAGIAEGTIFRVFDDKQELLAATLETILDRDSIDDALATIDPDLDFEAQLVAATALIQQRISDVWNLLSGLGSDLRSRVARPMPDSDELVAILATHGDRLSVDPTQAARLLRALTLSLTHPMVAGEVHAATDIVHFFLNGIEARP